METVLVYYVLIFLKQHTRCKFLILFTMLYNCIDYRSEISQYMNKLHLNQYIKKQKQKVIMPDGSDNNTNQKRHLAEDSSNKNSEMVLPLKRHKLDESDSESCDSLEFDSEFDNARPEKRKPENDFGNGQMLKKAKTDAIEVEDISAAIKEKNEDLHDGKRNTPTCTDEVVATVQEDENGRNSDFLANPWTDFTFESLVNNSEKKSKLCQWDFTSISLPDIGGKDTLCLTIPSTDFLPPNTNISEEYEDMCLFDVEDYRRHHPQNYE